MPVQLKLKEIRESRGLSQFELAKKTDMSPQNIAKLEQGRNRGIQFDTLEKLCQALGTGVQDLLVLIPNEPSPPVDLLENKPVGEVKVI